jgi:hypothetical protein
MKNRDFCWSENFEEKRHSDNHSAGSAREINKVGKRLTI